MKKLFLISIAVLLFAPLSRAQENSPIVLKKRVYYQNDKRLTNKDMKSIDLYNKSSKTGYIPNLNIGITPNGVGIV
jgi:hypothetical protein